MYPLWATSTMTLGEGVPLVGYINHDFRRRCTLVGYINHDFRRRCTHVDYMNHDFRRGCTPFRLYTGHTNRSTEQECIRLWEVPTLTLDFFSFSVSMNPQMSFAVLVLNDFRNVYPQLKTPVLLTTRGDLYIFYFRTQAKQIVDQHSFAKLHPVASATG